MERVFYDNRYGITIAALLFLPKNIDKTQEFPAVVIGPEFAEICGHKDEVFTVMAGSKLFLLTIGNVRDYLESVTIEHN